MLDGAEVVGNAEGPEGAFSWLQSCAGISRRPCRIACETQTQEIRKGRRLR